MSLTGWIAVLAAIGFLDSLYIVIQQFFPRAPGLCFDYDFDKVDCYPILESKYAKVLVVPNSWLGTLAYAVLAVMYWQGAELAAALDIASPPLFTIGALIATAGFVLSWYLLYVQARILRTFCIFCLTSTALITAITVLAWIAV